MLPDLMPRVARLLTSSGSTIDSVRDTLLAEGVEEYDIYLTMVGASLTYPHVKVALDEFLATHNLLPPTDPAPPIHD